MKKKTTVAVFFGGKSVEHEVSILSALNVITAIDRDKYDIVLIGIDRQGHWYLNEKSRFLLQERDPRRIQLSKNLEEIIMVPAGNSNQLINLKTQKKLGSIDVAFPVLHGTYGEDGSIQGMFRLADIPYVGADVLGSAVGMDKDVTKRLLRDAGIPVPRFITFTRAQLTAARSFDTVEKTLGYPMFVKPVHLGSSVGVSKVQQSRELKKAVEDAFKYGRKILFEEYVDGREIECSVLGNDDPIASLPGEIIPKDDFYSYDAKYIAEDGAILEVPAKLSQNLVSKIQDCAIRVFKTLCCQGMARVDFFLRGKEELIVNELNTIPGFTKISMYPKLWEVSGISYTELIDKLIQLALERHETEQRLKTTAHN